MPGRSTVTIAVHSITGTTNISPTSISLTLHNSPEVGRRATQRVVSITGQVGCSIGAATGDLHSKQANIVRTTIFRLSQPFCTRLLTNISGTTLSHNVRTITRRVSANGINRRGDVLRGITGRFYSNIVLDTNNLDSTRVVRLDGNGPIILLSSRSCRKPFSSIFAPYRGNTRTTIVRLFRVKYRHIKLINTSFVPTSRTHQSVHMNSQHLVNYRHTFRQRRHALARTSAVRLFS